MLNILVLCTGNSCRSILAEALFNHLGKGRIHACSAGSHPTGKVHPKALYTLAQHSLPIAGYRSKTWDMFEKKNINITITVCNNAAEETCPLYLNQTIRAHWGLPDPAKIIGTDDMINAAFEETYIALEQRIRQMLTLSLEHLSDQELTTELNLIGKKTLTK